MKSTVLLALIVVNAVLLASFAWRLVPDNAAMAQQATAARRTGDYLLIPAQVNGASSGIVVVLDQTSAQLSALTYNEPTGKIENMEKIDLRRVFQGAAAPRGGNR